MNSQLDRRDMVLGSGILLLGLSQFGVAKLPQSATQSQEPEKDLIFRTTDPRNAEPELNKLVASWITPTKHFYVRSHAPNPKIDVDQFRLSVEGMVDRPGSFSLRQLQAMKQSQVTATLTCAGNRRAEFNKEKKVGGVQWGPGAIGNAQWSGVPLAKVLEQVGVQAGAKHVWFEGLDEIPKGDKVISFGASIPIEKALAKNEVGALIVDTMNGQPLTPDHGAPLRMVVPGYIGARSVKWLGKIVVSDRTSPNHYLATAYKLVRETGALDWQESGPIYRYLVNAVACTPGAEATLKPGEVEVSGYVLPSGILGARIKKVLISADNGKTWTPAELTGEDADYCWQLWKGQVTVSAKSKEILVRALDNKGGFMPYRVPWNAKGYLQNSWYRLPVSVEN